MSRPARVVRARDLGPPDLPPRERPGQIFCAAASDGSSITVKADPVEREALFTQGGPFYFPPYGGSKGWVAIRLDHARGNWEEVAELIAISYQLIAPKRLAEQVTRPPSLDDSV
jgi:predicted DNA-binding protein (MmcQ/YjbR family)